MGVEFEEFLIMQPVKSHSKNVPSGPMMRTVLRDGGIPAQKVTRRRDTGHYIAEFYTPGMQVAVTPSEAWARSIGRIDGVRIIDRSDTIAEWRIDQPVIMATVTFTLDKSEV
jgi:hypothetical protein